MKKNYLILIIVLISLVLPWQLGIFKSTVFSSNAEQANQLENIKRTPQVRKHSIPTKNYKPALSGTPTIYLTDTDIKAFPTAEGWGKDATGGRGLGVFFVTNTNNSGTGSLRQIENDVQAAGGGNIIFRTGGTVNLGSELIFSLGNDNVTVYGQSAPGDGFAIHNNGTNIRGSNIIMRHLKFRSGDGGSGKQTLKISSSGQNGNHQNYMFDHLSLTWGHDSGNFGLNANAGDLLNTISKGTIQNSIIAESFAQKGSIFYGRGITKFSSLNNAYVNNFERNMRSSIGRDNEYEFMNNYIHNYVWALQATAKNKIDVAGNVWNDGPETQSGATIQFLDCSANNCGSIDNDYTGSALYNNDNIYNGSAATLNTEATNAIVGSRNDPSTYTVRASSTVKQYVLDNAGARRSLEGLDAVDQHQMDDLNNGSTGGLYYNTEAETVGLPTLSNGTPYTDTDSDGLDDDWEALNGGLSLSSSDILDVYHFVGFNVNQVRDVTLPNSSRYTALEVFMANLAKDWDNFAKVNDGLDLLNINGTPESITAYDPMGQDDGSFEIQDSGNTIKLTGNAWKKAPFNYTVSSSTVMEFDLKVTGTGEIHGVAFDNDDTLGGEVLFQFTGTQSDYGLQNYNTYSGSDWVHFSVPVGQHFTGTYNNIVFVGDKDSSPTSQESFFRNITFSEPTLLNINGTPESITAYDPVGQDGGSFEIQDSGNTIKLTENAWKKAPFNYTVSSGTVMEFDLKVTGTGEIHGIAFDNDDTLGGEVLFQFAGTQSGYGLQNYNTYSGSDWVHFSIPVGQHFTGTYNNIVFIGDKDSSPASQESFFRNITFNEPTTPNNYTSQNVINLTDETNSISPFLSGGALATKSIETSIVHNGSYSLKAVNNEGSSEGAYYYQDLPTEAGATYDYSVWGYETTDSAVEINFRAQDIVGSTKFNSITVLNQWQEKTGSITALGSTVRIAFVVGKDLNDTGYFDGLKITKNEGGAGNSFKAFLNLTETPSNQKSNEIIVSPNPSSNQVKVTLPHSSEYSKYTILSLNGVLIKKGVIGANQTELSISISNMEKGLYILNLFDEKGNNEFLKIVKK